MLQTIKRALLLAECPMRGELNDALRLGFQRLKSGNPVIAIGAAPIVRYNLRDAGLMNPLYCVDPGYPLGNSFDIPLKPYDFVQSWYRSLPVRTRTGERVTLGGDIAFAHIDGYRPLDDVFADWAGIHLFLEHGGFVVLSYHKSLVRKAMREGYRLITSGPSYLLQRV